MKNRYTKLYDILFNNIRFNRLNILLLGVNSDIDGWKTYFPNSSIYCSDTDQSILNSVVNVNPILLDKSDIKSLVDVFYIHYKTIKFDIIIDTGKEYFLTNWKVLNILYAKLTDGGIYIIENVLDFDQQVTCNSTMKKSGLVTLTDDTLPIFIARN